MTSYFNFNGLAKRQEYWAVMIIAFAFAFVGSVMLQTFALLNAESAVFALILLVVGFIALVWLQLATAARRCRDAAISPWWAVLFIIPYINFVVAIVFGVLPTKISGDDDA